ncbi:MAG TPA: acyloxyacyl hydrolase [Terracidiphilus sp.]
MTRTAKLFAIVLMAVSFIAASAQTPADNSRSSRTSSDKIIPLIDPANLRIDPVAQVRIHKSWEHGPFVNGGIGVGERSQYKFLWAGYQVGKPLTPVFHAGLFSGQFELAGNIMPLWQAYTPVPHDKKYVVDTPSGQPITCYNSAGQPMTGCELLVGGGTFRGLSLTPVILRWNFLTRSSRIQPWAQAAGGLIYTTHKFPPNYLSSQTINGMTVQLDGGTCVWNFSPQGGFGIHYFTRANRSIDLGVNGVHISSASLGDRNPGVNASVQVQLGYTFWK